MTKQRKAFIYYFTLQNCFLLVFALLIGWLWLYLETSKEEGSYPITLVAVLWLASLVFFLWLGNLIIIKAVQIPYVNNVLRDYRFLVQLALSLLYSLSYINFSYVFFKSYYTTLPPNTDQILLLNIYGILFLIPVLSVQFGLLFLKKWKKANLEGERLKKEQIQSELIALKSHLSPHFLFNNLNILSSLIDADNYLAQDFLDKFSDVYRYVLKNKDAELISLQEELDFIDAYVFLLNQRFFKEIKVLIEIPDFLLSYQIPPLALQILFENALKHNKMSEDKPLLITIAANQKMQTITVTNNLDIREVLESEKTGLGIENIRRRYQLIANKDIDVDITKSHFSISLHLIKPNE